MAVPGPNCIGQDRCGRDVLNSDCLGLRAKSVSSQSLPQSLGQIPGTRNRVVEKHGSLSQLCPEITE